MRSTVLLIIAVLAAVATLLASAPGEASLSAESEAIVAVNARELQATDEALRRSILEARLDLATDLAEVEAKALSRHVALEQIARAVDGHWPSDFALHALVEEVERAYRLDTAELALLGDRLRAAQGAGGGTEELRELDRVVGLTARRTSDSPAIALIEALDDRLTITSSSRAHRHIATSVIATFALLGACALGFRLRRAYRELEANVDERTQSLDVASASLEQQALLQQAMFDHLDDGLVLIDIHGIVRGAASRAATTWFGDIDVSASFLELLDEHDELRAAELALGLDALRDDELPVELIVDQLPRELTLDTWQLALSWVPLIVGGEKHLLLIASDVSAELAGRRERAAQEERISLFTHLAEDRRGTLRFIEDVEAMLVALGRPEYDSERASMLHTLKGNVSVFGLPSVATVCHRVEEHMQRSGGQLLYGNLVKLRASWSRAIGHVRPVVMTLGSDHVDVKRGCLRALADSVDERAPDAAGVLRAWTYETSATVFARWRKMCVRAATQLQKPNVRVHADSGPYRFVAEGWDEFWAASVHLARNALDHGVEAAAERSASGKPSLATLRLFGELNDAEFVLTFADDGRGIDWQAVRDSAVNRGVDVSSSDARTTALFTSGLSTVVDVTETSGRGVGLSAVRTAVERLGGTVDVSSTRGTGTTFVFRFPAGTVMHCAQGAEAQATLGVSSFLAA
ncbi:MAG: HPt (histidine-containing phosphotransfer) domain-containing protein [Bradymonadia bacterium]